jgi:uncharacterized protein YifN (PemK superfamily)
VVSRAVFIQKPKDPTVSLSIHFKIIQNNFIDSFFTDKIQWWWALDSISQVARKKVGEL